MRIIYDYKEVEIGNFSPGEVFIVDNTLYMMTDTYSDDTPEVCVCVDLETGCTAKFDVTCLGREAVCELHVKCRS